MIKAHSKSIKTLIVVFALFATTALPAQTVPQFNQVAQQSGLTFNHNRETTIYHDAFVISGGGAVGDINGDGYEDLYLIGGVNHGNALFTNLGTGTFELTNPNNHPNLTDIMGAGPVFADVDADLDLDLLVFSVNQHRTHLGLEDDDLRNRPRLLINDGDGQFTEQLNSGFDSGLPSYGGTLADLDRDGDLDMFMVHWNADHTTSKQLFWENDGTGHFDDVTIDYLTLPGNVHFAPYSFTPNITDLNGDGWLDVLLASDFETTRLLHSNGIINNQLTFTVTQPAVITDENGMGAALGDYDNDGDLDWFVTSIWAPARGERGTTGNRMYKNNGDGTFTDATDETGVREGYWGWGACFADFNNDGHLDIYHENGFNDSPQQQDPSRLFLSNGDGSFTEVSFAARLNYNGQGRGVSCFDYDLDGDLDILIMPNNASYQLYQNQLNNSNHHLAIKLFDQGPNPYAINARITLTTTASSQLREVSTGNNFVSNNPMTQHYGLGQETQVQSIQVQWPDFQTTLINQAIDIDATLSISRHCHTKYLIQGDIHAGTPVTVQLWVHAADGSAVQNTTVQLTVEKGPNQGHNANANSDTNGLVEFTLNPKFGGTDRLLHSFMHEGTPQTCRSLIRWNPNDLLFFDGFNNTQN